MAIEAKRFTIDAPPDFELGIPRLPLNYTIHCQDDGQNAGRPLLFFIGGFGFWYDDTYVAEKLAPYLAEKGFVTVTVGYHGSLLRTTNNPSFSVRPGWFDDFRRVSGVDVPDDLNAVLNLLRENQVDELPPEFSIIKQAGTDYESFGTLGALDHLQVYADLVRRRIPFDRERVVAFGTSHGAYLAMMMLKFAPHTLSAVIENSCWVQAIEVDMNNTWQPNRHRFEVQGVGVYYSNFSPWSRGDTSDSSCLTQSHLLIRDLREEHYSGAEGAAVMSYHGSDDTMIPADLKRQFWNTIATHVDLRTTMVTKDMVDGRLFKNTGHGLDASLRGLFDDAMAELGHVPARPGDDFERGETRSLAAGDLVYEVAYRPDYTFSATLR